MSQPAGTLAAMVLVAPRPFAGIEPTGTVVDTGTGREVLALLRGDVATRPNFDATLPGGMRAWLEDAAYDVVTARGEHAPPLVLGPRQILGTTAERGDDDQLSDAAVLSRLVHALFRQIVAAGVVGDPLADTLESLRAMGSDPVPDHVESLPQPARAALAELLGAHARTLEGLVPRLAPGWMPRTDDHVAVPLAGGRVVLHGVFDLLVGLPRPPTAALCAVGLSTGGPWARERRSLHYLALLEALRSGTPPFRLALLDSGSGRYGVEDVREEHLRAVASHIVAWLATEVRRDG